MRPWLHAYTLHDEQGRSGGVQVVSLGQQELLRAVGVPVREVAGTLQTPVTDAERLHLRVHALPGAGIRGLVAPTLVTHLSRLGREHSGLHLHLCRDLFTTIIGQDWRRSDRPFVVQPHGMLVRSERRTYDWLDRTVLAPVLSAAQCVLALNDFEAADLDERYSLRSISVLPNLTEVTPELRAAPPLTGGTLRLISVGRLHARKRPHLCLDTLISLRRQGVDASLTFVGPDEGEEPALAEMAADAGVRDAVDFVGGLPHEDVLRLMASAHVFLFAAQDEPHGLVLAEAAAVGLPQVSTPGVPLAHQHAGAGAALVARDQTGAAMGDAVSRLLQDKAAWRRASEAGIELTDPQATEKYRDGLLTAYGLA